MVMSLYQKYISAHSICDVKLDELNETTMLVMLHTVNQGNFGHWMDDFGQFFNTRNIVFVQRIS